MLNPEVIGLWQCCDVCLPGKQHLLQPVMLLCFHLVDQQLHLSLNIIRLCLTRMQMHGNLLASLEVLR